MEFKNFSKRRATSNAFSPASLNPKLWLDPADSSTITLNGADVSKWDDKSGNGNDATQVTASAQPLYNVASINGRNTLQCDGSNHFMDLDSILPNSGDYTFAIVIKPDAELSPTSSPQMLLSAILEPIPRSIFSTGNVTSGNDSVDVLTSKVGGPESSFLTGTYNTDPKVIVFKLTSGTVTISIDGVSLGITTENGGNTDLIGLQRLFKNVDGRGDFFDGEAGDMIYYDYALSSEEELTLTNYLLAKWYI